MFTLYLDYEPKPLYRLSVPGGRQLAPVLFGTSHNSPLICLVF